MDINSKSTQLRKKAESILQQKGIQDSSLYEKDLETLIEELSIHQIELEQQNEELKITQYELEISRNKYSDLFNESPNGYFIINSDSVIQDVNVTGAEMLKTKPSELLNQKLTKYIHPDSQDTFYFHIKKVLKSNKKETCELQLKKENEDKFYVILESVTDSDIEKQEENQIIRSAIMDITEKKMQQEKIRESEEKYRTIFENSGEGFFLMDRKIIDCNKQAATLFGCKEEELTGKDPAADLSPKKQPDGKNSTEAGKKYIENALQGYIQQFYWKHKTKDGRLFDTEITLNAIDTRDGKKMIAIIRDISEQIDHQKQVKEKNEEIQAQNEEYISLNEQLNSTNQRLKNTIEELKKSEQKFRNIAENIPGLVLKYKLNPDGSDELLYLSKSVEKIYEIPHDQAIRNTALLWERIHPDDLERHKESIKESQRNLSLWETEHRIQMPDGRVKWIHARGVPQKGHNGSVIWDTLGVDITDKKNTEIQLSEANDIINKSPAVAFLWKNKENWPVEFVSGNVSRIYGYEVDDFISGKVQYIDIIHKNDLDRIVNELIQYSKDATVSDFSHEYRIVSKSGEVKWVDDRTWIQRDSNGNITHFKGIILESTERKKAEQELLIKNRISNAFINTGDNNFYKDVLDIVKEAFQSKYGYFGYINENGDLVSESLTRDVWTECQVDNKSIVFPKESWAGLWGKSLKEKKTLYQNSGLKLPRGHVELTSAIAAPVMLNGKLIGQIALANKKNGYDESDKELINRLCNYLAPLLQSKLQEEEYKKNLLESKEKAEESDRLKSAFLANMSHEIRTPMNGIIGFTDLLRNNEFPKEKQDQFLEIIHSRSKHLLQIINDIVDISKIEANQLRIEKQLFNLNDMIHDLYNYYAAEIENTENSPLELKISKSFSRNESFVYADMTRIKQVLTNLLSNAIKFTESGYILFGYRVNKERNKLEFFVEDTGIGIPEDKKEDIFGRFRQADESSARKYEGTGLGLAISQNLVRLMDGEIWVESMVDKGSAFYFAIPFEKPGKDQPVEETKHSEIIKYNWKNHKILVVEDDPISREYLKEILAETGAEVLFAQSGNDGYQAFIQNKDLSMILMDIQLPDKNGREVTREIKEKNDEIPIIAQTAYAMQEDRKNCLKAGCIDYITKPIDPSALLSIMAKYIRK